MARGLRCVFGFAFLAAALSVLTGKSSAQDAPSIPDSQAPRIGTPQVGIVQDWSTQHVIYTRNGSVDDMLKVRNDPRFLNSFLLHSKREHPNQVQTAPSKETPLSENASAEGGAAEVQPQLPNLRPEPLPLPVHKSPVRNKRTKIDWAVDLGPTWGMAIGESPAFYGANANGTPACTTGPNSIGDFIVYSLKAAPNKGAQANLVGLTNIYAGSSPAGYCGANPTFLFSYAIGSGGSLLSPVLSLNGKKVAWIENSTSTTPNHAIFHVTTWAYGQGSNATAGSVAVGSGSSDVAIDYTSSAYSGCSASAGPNTNSEIYVDYPSDAAFVGADNGILYHVKGIFKGTPTFDFCIVVKSGAGTALSGPVYDSLLSPPEVFIADSNTLWAYTVAATSFTLKTSRTYGAGTLTGPGPLLDAFNNFIYLFSADDTSGHTSVTQMPTTLASSVVAPLGPASANAYPILFYGTFDNNYFTNGPKGANSTLYSCGTDSTTTTAQDLFAIGFIGATGLMNTTPVMSANKNVNPGGKNGTCSPITEFYDGTKDRIFVGMGQHNATTGANVVQMWDVTTQLTSTSATPTAQAVNYAGGSSGLIIDNAAGATAQAESVYFTTLSAGAGFTTCGANRYCAVKLTQTGLQ